MKTRFITVAAVLLQPQLSAASLCRTPLECGQTALCGNEGAAPLAREDTANICVGFHSANDGSGAAGKKAMFQVKVDHYSTMSVDTLRPKMGEAWSAKEPYSQVWVGLNGRRTIGQERGLKDGLGSCNATAASEVDGASADSVCFGWAEHNKPLIDRSNHFATGLTAVIHLDMGVVNRVQWDSSCNLCGGGGSELTCRPDGTNISCLGGAPCADCYAKLASNGCTHGSAVCAPKIYLAWLGTDKHGQPLLSAGSVLSRFAAYSVGGVTDLIIKEVQNMVEDIGGGGGGGGGGGDAGGGDTNSTG